MVEFTEMKSTLAFIIFVLAVVLMLYSISGKRYPRIPGDETHKDLEIGNNSICLECHGPGKKAALPQNHPPKFECSKCHKKTRKPIKSN
jgi:hypothetical protein